MKKLICSCLFLTVFLLPGYKIIAQDFLKIKSVIAEVNADSLIENLNLLTGEKAVNLNGQSIKISSRYRGSIGNTNAALFLKKKLSAYKSLKVSEQPLPDSGKNIIAIQTGTLNPKRQIIICAHFDSPVNGVFSPGADDDGSGTSALLEAARILSKYSSTNTIVYAFFDQEEDNLNGSEFFASQAAKNKDSILAVINLDMIGWDKNNQNDVEIDSRPVSSSEQLAKNIKEVNEKCDIGLYITLVSPGSLDADNASFWKYSLPAVLVIELYGNLNPYMHKTTDIVQNINKPFYEKCTKLGIASAARYTDLTVMDGATDVRDVPASFNSLEQNYPNPFNPETTIQYTILVVDAKFASTTHVTLKVYDLLGREVATLVDEFEQPGNYAVTFNVETPYMASLPSGVYYYQLKAGRFIQTKKLVLMK